MSTRLQRRVLNKSAAYTIVFPVDAPGTVFTNRGASAQVLLTLPTPNRSLLGVSYRAKALVAQAFGFASPVADTLVALSDAAADSVTVPTIGGELEAVCVEPTEGTFRWAVSGIAVGHTYTVNT